MRFAVRRLGIPDASPRSHGVPRRDIFGRIHVSVAGVSAGHAAEHSLALAIARCDVPARRAALARERGMYLLHPAGGLVPHAAYQQSPGRGENAPVQPGLLPYIPNTLAKVTDISGEVKRRFLCGLKVGASTPRP